MRANHTPIVDSPCMLRASATAGTAVVYGSVLVREDDRLYRPVAEFLADHGARLRSVGTVEDPDMMFGSATLSVYALAA